MITAYSQAYNLHFLALLWDLVLHNIKEAQG